MNYKIGYKIKPKRITEDNIVIFTDGTNEVPASQKSCHAYGYKWNKSNSTCIIGGDSGSLSKKLNEKTNKIGGYNNTTGGYVESSVVYGSDNYLEGGNKNIIVNGDSNRIKGNVYNSSIISGNLNVINEDVNNSSIISGTGAVSIRDAETIVGGFYEDGLNKTTGETTQFVTQSSIFNMQATATTTALTKLKVQNGDDYFKVHPLSFIYVTVKCMTSGNGVGKVSAGTLNATVGVGSNGIPSVRAQTFTHENNSNSTYGNKTYYIVNQGSPNPGLVIRSQGVDSETVVMTATVSITETIHGDLTDLSN